jgi:hypothetical protein
MARGVKARRPVTEISDNGRDYSHWHINKGIPVVWLIGSVLIGFAQFGGLVWYVSQFNTRFENAEKIQTTTTSLVEKLQTAIASQNIETAKLGEKVVAVQAATSRIEALLVKPR